jgi:peptide deformylase
MIRSCDSYSTSFLLLHYHDSPVMRRKGPRNLITLTTRKSQEDGYDDHYLYHHHDPNRIKQAIENVICNKSQRKRDTGSSIDTKRKHKSDDVANGDDDPLKCSSTYDINNNSQRTSKTRRELLFRSLCVIPSIIGNSSWIDRKNQEVWAFPPPRATTATTTSSIPTPMSRPALVWKEYYPHWTGTSLSLLDLESSVHEDNTILISSSSSRFTGIIPSYSPTSSSSRRIWKMGRWPDPMLRRPAEEVVMTTWGGTHVLYRACEILIDTAHAEHAAGLAAQQCGINARIIAIHIGSSSSSTISSRFLSLFQKNNDPNHSSDIDCPSNDLILVNPNIMPLPRQRDEENQREMTASSSSSSSSNNEYRTLFTSNNMYQKDKDNIYLILINPRIVQRSNEMNMKLWTEYCLVLPTTFTATVLRDDWIEIEYQSIHDSSSSSSSSNNYNDDASQLQSSSWHRIRCYNDLSRAIQHELDHDRGILLLDHISMNDMENDMMKFIEQDIDKKEENMSYYYSYDTNVDDDQQSSSGNNRCSNKNKQPKWNIPNRQERITMAYDRYLQESMMSTLSS